MSSTHVRPVYLRTPGVDLHYVVAGSGAPLVLLHGFPQTWHQWRQIIEELADQHTVIAPSLRGLGGLRSPQAGYDKYTMANDLRLIVEHEVGSEAVMVVGHDMGAFVAYAYARRYPEVVTALMLVDAVVLGTDLWDALRARAWHIGFHMNRDLAEGLVAGRELMYIDHFIRTRLVKAERITDVDIATYAAAYSKPGAFRAAFEMYRALDDDAQYNRGLLGRLGKMKTPLAVVASAGSVVGSGALEAMAATVADDWTIQVVSDVGHWLPEEKPEAVIDAIRGLALRVHKRE